MVSQPIYSTGTRALTMRFGTHAPTQDERTRTAHLYELGNDGAEGHGSPDGPSPWPGRSGIEEHGVEALGAWWGVARWLVPGSMSMRMMSRYKLSRGSAGRATGTGWESGSGSSGLRGQEGLLWGARGGAEMGRRAVTTQLTASAYPLERRQAWSIHQLG